MSEEVKKEPRENAEVTKPLELLDHDLEQVSGGAGSIEKTHPKLTETSSSGKHLDKVTL
jgi:hypothetical protein